MAGFTFQYEAIDNATPTIDRVTNRLQGLRSEYKEMKRSIGDIKQALNTMSGLGFGFAGGAMAAMGMGKDAKETGPTKAVENKLINGLNTVASIATLTTGGVLGSMLMDRFSGDSGRSIAGGGRSFSGGKNAVGGGISNFANFASNMMIWEGATNKSWGQLMRGKGMPSVSGMGGGFAGGAASVGALAKGGGFMARMGAGLATGGIALVAQLAYEYGVQPIIDQVTEKRMYTDEYLKSIGTKELSTSMEQQIWNESIGRESGGMYFMKDLLGLHESSRGFGLRYLMGMETTSQDEMRMQISGERGKRLNEVTKALWLQNRE